MLFDPLRSLAPADLTCGEVRLDYLAAGHREGLRAACAADTEIWTTLYPVSMVGADFDRWWEREFTGPRILFAVLYREQVVGTTCYLNLAPDDATIEIGGTYLAPSARGTRVNDAMKRLMLAAAFAAGARRVEFRVDAINMRSRGAVAKLGGHLDGILRAHRVTWTGRLRDTCVFSVLADEWPAVRDRLDIILRG